MIRNALGVGDRLQMPRLWRFVVPQRDDTTGLYIVHSGLTSTKFRAGAVLYDDQVYESKRATKLRGVYPVGQNAVEARTVVLVPWLQK